MGKLKALRRLAKATASAKVMRESTLNMSWFALQIEGCGLGVRNADARVRVAETGLRRGIADYISLALGADQRS